MITQEMWMDLRALARQGSNFSQLGALVGLDRRTVKKQLQLAPPPVYRRAPRSSTLAPFRPLIEPWRVRAPGLRATRSHRDLRTHDGFPGSYPMVQRRVRPLRPPRPVDAHIP